MEKSAIAAWKAAQLAKGLLRDKVGLDVLKNGITATNKASLHNYYNSLPYGARQQVLAAYQQLQRNHLPFYKNFGSKLRNTLGVNLKGEVPAAQVTGTQDATTFGKRIVEKSTDPTDIFANLHSKTSWDGKVHPSFRRYRTLEDQYNLTRTGNNLYFTGTNVPWRGDPELGKLFQESTRLRNQYLNKNTTGFSSATPREGQISPVYKFEKTFNPRYEPYSNTIYLPTPQTFSKPNWILRLMGKEKRIHPERTGAATKLENFKAIKEHEQGHWDMSSKSPEALDLENRKAMADMRAVLRGLGMSVKKGLPTRLQGIPENPFLPGGPRAWLEGVNNYVHSDPGTALRNIYVNRFNKYITDDLAAEAARRGYNNTVSRLTPERLDRAKSGIEQIAANYNGLNNYVSTFGK